MSENMSEKNLTDKNGMHFLVSGKVQGVWFRVATQTKAKELNLTGWVRNLPDGRVEAMVFGRKNTLLELYTWLQHGPELAKVDAVTLEEIDWQSHERFAIK